MAEEKMEEKKLKNADIEKIVVELAEKGESPAKIGLILRDQYGVPKAKLLGKKIIKIITDAKIKIKSEKEFLKEKIDVSSRHISKNKHDYTAARALTKKLWILHKLEKTQ